MSSSFNDLLYPMLSRQEVSGPALVAALEPAGLEKAEEAVNLRQRVIAEQGPAIAACAAEMARRFAAGGKLLSFGNGGSATAAADIVADFMTPPLGQQPLPAIAFTNDVATVTAVANDVSFADVFLRQVIAFGKPNDIALAWSTSGNSENLIRAFQAAKKLGLLNVGLAGYDGGRMKGEPSGDYVFVVPSTSIHRIQEVQSLIGHCLRCAVDVALSRGASANGE